MIGVMAAIHKYGNCAMENVDTVGIKGWKRAWIIEAGRMLM